MPNEISFLDDARALHEDAAERSRVETLRWLAILEILLPAAINSAAAGNVTMKTAVTKIWPLLPKTKRPSPNPPD